MRGKKKPDDHLMVPLCSLCGALFFPPRIRNSYCHAKINHLYSLALYKPSIQSVQFEETGFPDILGFSQWDKQLLLAVAVIVITLHSHTGGAPYGQV